MQIIDSEMEQWKATHSRSPSILARLMVVAVRVLVCHSAFRVSKLMYMFASL